MARTLTCIVKIMNEIVSIIQTQNCENILPITIFGYVGQFFRPVQKTKFYVGMCADSSAGMR